MDEFQGHLVTKIQSWDWIPACLTPGSWVGVGAWQSPIPLNRLNPVSSPYEHWDLEMTELKANRSQSLEDNLGFFQRKEFNRSRLSIIAGLRMSFSASKLVFLGMISDLGIKL